MAAERGVETSCTEANTTTLSATQSTLSTPALRRKSDHRPSLPGIEKIALFGPDLLPTTGGEPIPLILLEESPLGAISQLQSANSPKRAKRKRWKDHQNPSDGQATGTRAVKGLKEVLPSIPRIQTARGPLQEKPVTTMLPANSYHLQRQLTKKEIKQGMLKLKEGVTKLDKQRLNQPCHPLCQSRTEHEQTSNTLCEITKDKASENKEPAYIPTTIITGCGHQTSPSAARQEELADHLRPPTITRPDELNCGVLAVSSLRNNSDGFHTDRCMSSKQNPISSAGGKLIDEPPADTTCLERGSHKMQLEEGRLQDRRILRVAMLALEDNLLRKSTFIQDQALQAANQCKNPSVASQRRQQLILERELSLVDRQMQMLSLPEEHSVYPKHEDEDDTESRLEGRTPNRTDSLSPRLRENDGAEWEVQGEAAGLQHFLRCLKTLAQLYWSTVWPMLDPRTLRVEHDGPMPFWKACLLIALAAPAVALGFAVAVQGIKFVMLMAWLLNYVDDGSAIWA